MKKRDLEDWELAECMALKKAINSFNAGKPRAERLSQGRIADALGMNQGSVSAYVNGTNALNVRVATEIAALIGVPVRSFSPRLADEIKRLAALAPDYDQMFDQVDAETGQHAIPGNRLPGKTAAEPATDVKEAAAAKVLEMLRKHKGLDADIRGQIVKVVEQTVTEVQQSNVITADFSRSARVRDGELLIPQYDVRGSMGHGQLPADYTEFVRNVVVTEKQLEKLTLKYTEATNLAIITGWGQSMAPTIQDQDPVVVDRGITSYQDDGIYVITWQGHLFIKRVHLASGDKLKIISDCRPHDSDTVDPEEIYVHGKVLYIWNGNKA